MPDNLSTITLDVAGTISTSSVAGPKVVPFDADIADVIAVVGTAPTGAALIFDVLKNGTSIFAAALGTIALLKNAQGGTVTVGTTDTTIPFESADGARDVKPGQVILIGSEQIKVGDVQGSSQVDGGLPVYNLTGCTRAYAGTSAATHAAGTAVYPAKPSIAAGATKSSFVEEGLLSAGTYQVAQGDSVSLTVSQVGSSVAGAALSVSLELVQR